MTLQTLINDYVKKKDAAFGVYVKHLETGEEASISGDRLFQMASVFKIPILAALFEKVYNGEINLHDRVMLLEEDYVPGSGIFQELDYGIQPTIKDLATLMIIVSDNLATDRILKLIGGPSYVQERMRELGFGSINLQHTCWELLSLSAGIDSSNYSKELFETIINRLVAGKYDWDSIVFQEREDNNTSTPRGMCKLLEAIADGKFISRECSQSILNILFKQHYQQRIPGKLPKNKKVANKTGSLGTMFNDAAIVYLPNGTRYVMTVYSIGSSLDYQGDEPIADISLIAYNYFMKK